MMLCTVDLIVLKIFKFENVNGRSHGRTDERRLDYYTISSPCEPLAEVS